MTIRILTIPDESSQWPGWLEQQLVSLHLRDVVTELKIVAKADDSERAASKLSDIFSKVELAQVVASGLGSFQISKLQLLFGSPQTLIDLQEHILTTGSPYWDSLSQTSDAATRASELRAKLDLAQPVSDNAKPRLTAPAVSETRSGQSRFLLAISSLAAVLLFAAFLWPRGLESSGRILGTPGLTVADVETSQAYLERLATAGNTWFDQSPRNAADLERLLSEVSSDCQLLIDADHPLLAAQELSDGTTARDWFVAKCTKWKSDIDQTLASLQSGSIDFETARSQADVTMMKLVNALRAGPPV